MATMKTYDPTKVTIIVINKDGKAYPIGGFADGTSVKITRTSESYKKSTGMDGITSRIKNLDKSGEITLTLAQTSLSNDVLTVIENSSSDGDLCSIIVEDSYGGSKYRSSEAWIKKSADAEYSKDITNREWTFECADLSMITNGSQIPAVVAP